VTGNCTRHNLSTDDLTSDVVTLAGKLLASVTGDRDLFTSDLLTDITTMAGRLLASVTGDCTRHDLSTDDLTSDVATLVGCDRRWLSSICIIIFGCLTVGSLIVPQLEFLKKY